MAPPKEIAIATSVLQRLVKEESSYHREAQQQRVRIAKLQQNMEGENAEFELQQERKALAETENLYPQLSKQIREAITKVREQLEDNKDNVDKCSPEEVSKAKEAVAAGLKAVRETS